MPMLGERMEWLRQVLRRGGERYGGRESWSAYERCRGIEERWRWHIIRNAFVHNFIAIAVVRKAFHCVIAEKWLKQTYIMNGRDKKGEEEGERAASSAGRNG